MMNEMGDNEGIEINDLLNILANERRRHCIRYIANYGQVSKADLATELSGTYGGDDYKREYVSLHQQHLDRMAEVGVVRIQEDDSITFGPNGELAVEALRRLETVDDESDAGLRNLLRPVLGNSRAD